MILNAQPSKGTQIDDEAGPSGHVEPPPPFEETAPLILPHDISAPPPEFSLYDANFFTVGNGDIVSHDPHLNQDGEALYRFLLSQSGKPGLMLHCRGHHREDRVRWVTRVENGRTVQATETENVDVVDFDFKIDVGQYILPEHITWSVPDHEPAYRGKMSREVDNGFGHRYRPEKDVREQYEKWRKYRAAKGLPPWSQPLDNRNLNGYHVLRSSRTLREWADDYCRSPKYLKEWVYEKVVYGWDFEQLETAVRETIASTYSGEIDVTFIPSGNKVYIRPDNRLSRTLSNKWLKFLLIILLIYPFIWLFKRFHSRGGGRWEICGEAYAFKRIDDSQGESSSPQSESYERAIGMREGEFFKLYELTILRAIGRRHQSSVPLSNPNDGRSTGAARLLDGY